LNGLVKLPVAKIVAYTLLVFADRGVAVRTRLGRFTITQSIAMVFSHENGGSNTPCPLSRFCQLN
jgi:hypothetical protein